MNGKVSKKPMPVERAIQWLPTLDSHHVLATLEPGAGGRRQLFIEQGVLVALQSLAQNDAASPTLRATGLLLGRRYDCPVTRTRYLIIEKYVGLPASSRETLANNLRAGLAELSTRQLARVMGWYRSTSTLTPELSPDDLAIHLSFLSQPWQTTLLFGTYANQHAGAFFLHDRIAARSFAAPFHELIDDRALKREAKKPTRVNWPTYLTNESVAPLPLPTQPVAESTRPRSRGEFAAAWDALRGTQARPGKGSAQGTLSPPQLGQPLDVPREPTSQPAVDEPRVTKPPDIEKRREIFHEAPHRVADTEDTSRFDRLDRYVDLARAEGFFLVARFGAGESPETLWLLHEPLNGLLLTILADDDELVEADLHYNLRTENQAVLDTVFEEHRHLDSGTVYLRESSLDGLRALCRRLRATEALVPEWKASPPLYLLTPSEWEAAAASAESMGEPNAVKSLNDHRIASLPEVIADRYRLRSESG